MESLSHEEYMRNKARAQQVEQILLGGRNGQLAFASLSRILPGDAMAQVPILAACWGAHELVEVLRMEGYPLNLNLRQAPGIPFVNLIGVSDDKKKGVGIVQVAVRHLAPGRSALANLKAVDQLLATLEPSVREGQLIAGVVDILANYPKMSLDKASCDMDALRYLHLLGVDLGTASVSRKVARLAATYCVNLGDQKDPRQRPECEQAMLGLLSLLENMGVRHDDLCAYTHARAIAKDYKRYTHRSPLPILCQTLTRNGYELCETSVMGRPESPMATMIAFGLVQGVEAMLNQGARLDWQSPHDGSTLLMVGCGGKRSTLDAMAKIPIGSFKPIANFCNNNGETALHLAVRSMSAPMVKRCFQEGVDPDITNKNNKTAFDLLASGRGKNAQENFDAIISMFKEHGYGGADHEKGKFALHAAARSLSVDQVMEMLQAGADMHQLDRRGESPMEMALARQPSLHDIKSIKKATSKQLEIVRSFLEAGYDINQLHGKGHTMLLMAAQSRRWILAKQLLEHGADAALCDDNGNHPFQILEKEEQYFKIEHLVRGQEQALIAIAAHLIKTDPAFSETGDNDRLMGLRRVPTIWQAIGACRLEARLDSNTAAAGQVRRTHRPRL